MVALEKIVSGGQTGVDRAALDVALELALPRRGWCPRGRWAEDGVIDEHYPLTPTPSGDPAQRTQWNVRDSDATLIIASPPLTGGTALTERCLEACRRPHRVVDPDAAPDIPSLRRWLDEQGVRVLNVAGPRESHHPGIYLRACTILRALLQPPAEGTER